MQNGSSGWEKQLADVLDDFDQTTVWRVVGQLMKVGIRTIEAVCEYNVMWKLEDFE
jgi:hypothetical protein